MKVIEFLDVFNKEVDSFSDSQKATLLSFIVGFYSDDLEFQNFCLKNISLVKGFKSNV